MIRIEILLIDETLSFCTSLSEEEIRRILQVALPFSQDSALRRLYQLIPHCYPEDAQDGVFLIDFQSNCPVLHCPALPLFLLFPIPAFPLPQRLIAPFREPPTS